jgi:hypothetical protein
MARKRRRAREPFELPAALVPDFDNWATPAEEAKRARLDEWLTATDNADRYFFEWMPAFLAERRRLQGMPPRPPARRRGPLPDSVRRLLESLEEEDTEGEGAE